MKKHILLSITLMIVAQSFCQITMSREKKALLGEINQYVSGLVSVATYTNTMSEVYNALYSVATKEYNQIVRESEKKGYIEAKQESDLYREYATFEVRGDAPPYKVTFQVKKESRIKTDYVKNTYGNWYAGEVSSSYYTKLQRQVYEQLIGKVELPQDLQDKINRFNAGESRDSKKILRGIDY